MMKHRLKRAISLLCAFAICVGLLPAGALAVNESANLSGGINGYQATMQADVITSNGWRDAFVVEQGSQGAVSIEGTQRSSALNGKIWADKSVAIGTDKEFDVTFSTLGQTFASTEQSTEQVAFDVVFVVDRSGSMNYGQSSSSDSDAAVGSTRMDATVAALNSAAEVLMQNEQNRMAVIPFNTSATDNWVALNHYERNGTDPFFSYYSGYFGRNLSFQAADTQEKNIQVTGGTNQQDGFFKAADILTSADFPEDSPTRIPVIIMLTDGTPEGNYATEHYKTGRNNDGSATPEKLDRDALYNWGWSTETDDRYYTICTAAYQKDQITKHYQQHQSDEEDIAAKIYTIGLGLAENSDDHIMLNPEMRNPSASNQWINDHVNWTLSGTINDNSAENMGFSSYEYADDSFVGQMTSEELEDVFNNIISSITSITGGEDVGESTGGRDKVTYYDTLGEGVRFTGTMTLRVPKFDQTENGGLTQGNTDVYELTAYAAVNAGGINADTQMNMENAPDYLAAGGRIEFRPSSEYQKALEGLNVSVTMLSSGKRQLQVDIPPSLMAYNIINTNTTETTGTTYAYYEAKEPLQLTYSVQMREDVNNAGSYLIGAPAETYVEFYPSSAQDAEGNYEMPYYWPGGQFNNDDTQNKGQTGGQVDKVAGSSDYVYSATKGNNNNVRIYLGNNGLYTLTGKTMNLTVNWADGSDADGLRPSSVTLRLYVDRDGDGTGSELEPIGESVALPAANGVDETTHNDTLKYTFEGLQVYFPEGKGAVAKYYVAFLGEDGQPLTFDAVSQNAPYSEYKYNIDNTSTGAGQQGDNYFLFDGYKNDQTALDGNLELTLSHQKATIDYTVTKEWDGGQGTSATMRLLADGVLADESLLGEQEGTVTLNGSEETPWSHTWKNLPKYKDGHEIVYRAAETAYEGTAGVYFQTSYDFTTSNTTTVTNSAQNAEQAKMNFTARVFWNDAENQDGMRPEKVTLKLVAKVGEKDVSGDAVFGEPFAWTKDVASGDNNTWTVVWENLPRFTTEGEQITYSIVELNSSDLPVNEGEGLDNNYTVSNYNAVGDGYMTVTNTHTPATVAITITKEWDDSNNQDGRRPEKIEGILYTRSGDSYTPVRTWSIENNTTEGAHTTTITNLPAKANGNDIQYYVSEHAVPEYDTSAGDQETGPYFAVGEDNTITLTNTHTVSTVTYTVDLTWDDNNNIAGKRPDTVMVKLGGEYYVTLTVGDGNTGITGVASSKLPNGAQASWSGNTLTISDLPQFVNGVQQTYQGSVSDIDEYSETITGFTTESVSYTLSYAGSTTYDSLGFTKTWVNYTNNGYDMRPSTTEYAQYLKLQSKVGDAQWSAVEDAPDPRITVSGDGDNYTVTYSGLPMYGEGGAIQYQVVESAVPNFETANDAVALKESGYDTLTNTFELDAGNTYGKITVTKVWDDADNTSQRPGYDNDDIDPLHIKLYRATDGTHVNGIAPSSITVNDNNTWTYTWDAGTVLKTDKDGTSIDYVAYEGTVPTGYITTDQSVAVTENGDVKPNAKITNTYSGSAATGTLTITKSWQDDEQYTDKRPASLTFTVTGKVAGGTNNISRTVTMSNDWADVVAAGLPLTINGQKVTYTVTETNIPDGYSAEYSGEVVLADVQGNAATITVTNTYHADEWTLTYNANGGLNEPASVTVAPAQPDVKVNDGTGMTYSGYTFLGWTVGRMPVITTQEQYNDIQSDIYTANSTYTMTGDATLYAVWAVDSNGDNKPDYEQKQITVNVVWMDNGNRCGIRPNEIAFKLNGTEYPVDLTDEKGVLVTTNEGNTQWIYTVPTLFDEDASFTIDDISDIVVTPKTHADPNDTTGYTSSVAYADDVFTITLTHTPETTSHSVEKDWDFGNATFTTGTATIQLFANGQPALDSNNQPLTQTFEPEGSKPLGWNDLPKYEGGQLITYQAIETQVVDTSGNDVTAHFRAEYDTSTPGMTKITNTYTELRNITLHYFWDDNNNAAGERPTEVTVQLFYTISDDTTTRAAGVQPVENSEKTISADSEGNWNVTWTDLPIYDVDGSGKVLNYEAHVVAYTDAEGTEHNNLNLGENNDELTGSNYTFDVVSFGMDSVFIMNSAMDTTTDFKVTKQWNDANNAYSTRPDTIWINLMQDGVIYQSAEVKADASGNWTYTWADLPVYPTGSNDDYDYTVSEIPVPGYTATVNGNTITNALDALSNPDDPDNQLTVTFVYNNGQQNTTQTVSFGGTATSITPTWDGHVFKGWYTDNGTFVNLYDFTDPVTDNITLYAKWVSIHDGTEDKDDHHFVTFVYTNASATNNGTAIAENTKIQVACGSDYTFTAAADSGYILNTPTKVGSATLVANGNNSFTLDNITSDITVTITATRQTTGGGSSGGGGTTRPELEKGDHFAYIVGYEDGTVRPENNITRAEVATIFFRLLTEESREAYYSEVNAFTDVSDGDWYNNAISTLVNADIITGYTDGSFRPDAYITRAELAAIASRFDDISGGETRLTDIDGHWAEELISSAYNKGWVDGYPDGSFRPDQNITRAEVMTLVNRVLERAVDQDGMLDDMVTWSDNQPSSWYYEAVQEATNSHDYSRDEGETLETWTEITPPRDWTELEK